MEEEYEIDTSFQKGDLVRLRSGGPLMVVDEIPTCNEYKKTSGTTREISNYYRCSFFTSEDELKSVGVNPHEIEAAQKN